MGLQLGDFARERKPPGSAGIIFSSTSCLSQKNPSRTMFLIRLHKGGSTAKPSRPAMRRHDLGYFPDLLHRSLAFFASKPYQTAQSEFLFDYHCRTRPRFHRALKFSRTESRGNFLRDGHCPRISCGASYRLNDASRSIFSMLGGHFEFHTWVT
jgi:hypothetical protein